MVKSLLLHGINVFFASKGINSLDNLIGKACCARMLSLELVKPSNRQTPEYVNDGLTWQSLQVCTWLRNLKMGIASRKWRASNLTRCILKKSLLTFSIKCSRQSASWTVKHLFIKTITIRETKRPIR